jgi:hypothetical protein
MSAIAIAFVPTVGAVTVDPERWGSVLQQAGLPVETTPQADGPVVSVTLTNGGLLGVAVVPKPIPASDLAAHREGSMPWPDAAEALDASDTHLVITVTHVEAVLERQMLLTFTALLTAELVAAPGIYWGQVPHVSSTEMTGRVLAQAMEEGDAPALLWVAWGPAPAAEGAIGIQSRGLSTFGHRELWISSEAMDVDDLWGQGMSIAHYLMTTDAVLEPGHTLGEDDDQRIPIEGASLGGVEVLRIRFP